MIVRKGEINLMPAPLQQARLRGVYVVRLRRLLYAVVSVLIPGVLLAGASWWYLTVVQRELAESVVGEVTAPESVARAARRLNEFLGQFEQQRQALVPRTPLLAEVLAAAPAGVRFTELSFDRATRQLAVAGVAEQRTAIVAFQRALEKLAWAEQVGAPLSNFSVGGRNEFQFTITVREDV